MGWGRHPGRGKSREEEGPEERTLPPTSLRSSPKPAELPVWVWEGRSGCCGGAAWAPHPRLGARIRTWLAERASQAGRPGRGGCERARPRPLSLARVSGEAVPRGAGGARSLSPAAGGALYGGGGSESHLPATGRLGRGRRRRRGKRRRREHSAPAGAYLPGSPQSQLKACTRPPPPAQPGPASSRRQPPRQPLQVRPGPPGPVAATRSRRRV